VQSRAETKSKFFVTPKKVWHCNSAIDDDNEFAPPHGCSFPAKCFLLRARQSCAFEPKLCSATKWLFEARDSSVMAFRPDLFAPSGAWARRRAFA
jgi:hypothetical protein